MRSSLPLLFAISSIVLIPTLIHAGPCRPSSGPLAGGAQGDPGSLPAPHGASSSTSFTAVPIAPGSGGVVLPSGRTVTSTITVTRTQTSTATATAAGALVTVYYKPGSVPSVGMSGEKNSDADSTASGSASSYSSTSSTSTPYQSSSSTTSNPVSSTGSAGASDTLGFSNSGSSNANYQTKPGKLELPTTTRQSTSAATSGGKFAIGGNASAAQVTSYAAGSNGGSANAGSTSGSPGTSGTGTGTAYTPDYIPHGGSSVNGDKLSTATGSYTRAR